MNYEKQAQDFLKQTETDFKAEFLRHGKHFEDDKDTRDIYKITLKRGTREYVFNFGQSINDSGEYWLHGKSERGIAYALPNGLLKVQFVHPILFQAPHRSEWERNHNYSKPSAYDVLACLQKYDVGSFENFCGEFGYNTDSRKAEKVYQAVKSEYDNLKMLYTDKELELMQEIQ